MKMLRNIALVLLLLAGFSARVDGVPKVTRIDAPRRMLFLGNSFTYFNDGVPLHVRQLAVATDNANASSYAYKMVTISGAYLHELEPMVPSAIKSDKWDIVVLQGQSQEPMASNKEESERFRATARAFDQVIRAAGAKTVLYMTWAFRDKREMTNLLSAGYVAAGDELGALVVPVGLAFERSRSENPTVDLYYLDGKHPNLEGTYLAACVFYGALYNRSPEGNSYVAGLNAEIARKLQKTAWDTVKAFYGKAPDG
jgi:Domain of unknown function (DUF4886)